LIDSYETGGRREAMLRFGPATGPVVVVALPLFDEANRTRAFAVSICRALAKRGVASVLPDMPGQGESFVPTEAMALIDLEHAHQACIAAVARDGRRVFAVGVRSGALLDAVSRCHGRWHLAPQDGPTLVRELTRIKQATVKAPLGELWYRRDTDTHLPVEIAGNLVSPAFLTALQAAEFPIPYQDGAPLRTVRLDTDPKPADRHVPGAPLWRRAEPDNDPALAALLGDDIADWIATCER
jgi:hypothetical protein